MTDQDSTPPPNVAVEVVARPPHTCFLVVHYDGLTPPVALFADLQMIGWTPPVLAPPPRAAIDWATPDPATGESFTVRNWRVEGATVEPPPGSGPRGSWNPHEGDAFLRSLHGVLQRHAVTPVDGDGRLRSVAPPPPPTATAPPRPPSGAAATAPRATPAVPKRRTGLRSLSGRLRDAAESASRGSLSATPDEDARVELLSLVLSIPEDGRLALRATAAPARFPAIEDGLRALDVDVWFTTEAHEEQQTFRGSSVSTTVMRFRVTALASSGAAADAVTVFEENGAKVEVEVVDAAGARAIAEAADLAVGAAEVDDGDEELALVRRRHPCVHVVVEAARSAAVVDMIQRLGLQHARQEPTELESVGVFRGTTHVTRRPAVAFEVWVPPAHAARVLDELAAAGGVDAVRQPDQVWISPAEVAPVVDAEEPVEGFGAAPLDIDRDLAGLIDDAPDRARVMNR